MEEKSDDLDVVRAEEDSESNYSIQGSEEVSNDLDQSGSSIQGSEEVKDNLSQSDSSHQGSETGKYNKVKDENANIKTLLGKRPAAFPGLPNSFLNVDNKGIKKHCDNSNKPGDSSLPVISDVWSEKNPTELSGLFGSHGNNPDKHKVEKEWQETFKISELPDPSVLFGDLDENVFKKPMKPAPIPLAKVSWRPPVLTGENSLDEKLLPGSGNVAQSVTSGGFKPPSPLGITPCSFLKYDSFNTCGGSVICMNQTGKPDNNPAFPHPQSTSFNRAAASEQRGGHKLPVGMPQSHAAHEVQKKVLKKLDKPEKSHLNRVIKHASAPPRSSPTRPKSASAQPRNVNPRPRNTPAQPRPLNTPRKQQAKQEKYDVPMVAPPSEHGMDPPQQFEFTLGSHYTGGNMFCARKVDVPANQMIVPQDFINGLMKTPRGSHIDPAVDIVTRNDIKRFLSVPERKAMLSSYPEPKMEPLPLSVAPHSAIKALLSRSPVSPGVPSPGELRMSCATTPSRPSSSAPSSLADARWESKSLPSPRSLPSPMSLPSPGKDPKKASKPTSPTFAEKIAKFKAEIPLKQINTSGSKLINIDSPQPSASVARRRNTVETDSKISTGIDEKQKSWLNSDSLLPPNMPLFLNTSEKKDTSLAPKCSFDNVSSSPRTESVTSSSSLHYCAPLHAETGSLLPPNYPLSLESPTKQSLRSPRSVSSPRKGVERPMVSPDARRPMSTNIGSLLPPGMPWQLESPEKRPITSSALTMELPRIMPTPPLPVNMPWSFSSGQTSTNLQYNIQLSNAMKRNVPNPALPNFPRPFVSMETPIMMPATPEIPRMKQTSYPSATVTCPVEKSQPSDISPSRSKDDGYSTSGSLQESPDNRKTMLLKTNSPSSPSGARKAAPPASTPHICYSPKKRRFIPLTPDQHRPSEAEIRSFYNMPALVPGPGPVPRGLETLPHHSPLRRNFEPAEPIRRIPYDHESLLSPTSSPYRRNFGPSEPSHNVHLLGMACLPLAGGELAANQGGSARAGDYHTQATAGAEIPADGRIVCAADSTEEGGEQPLNLVVAKPRVELVCNELPKPHYEQHQRAVDLRRSPCEAAMDLRVHKHESADISYQYRTQYPRETHQNFAGSSGQPKVRPDTKVPVNASMGRLQPSRNELEVAKDSGVDVVNHFLQSMHSIRYKDSKGEASTQEAETSELENGAVGESTNQGDSQDYQPVQHTDNTTTASETNSEGKSQDEKQDRKNGTLKTESLDSKSSDSTLMEVDHMDYEVSALTETDLDISKGRSHGNSVSTVASDCHFCTVPEQDETSLAESLPACPPRDIDNVQHGDDADVTKRSHDTSSTLTVSDTSCHCSQYSCSCSKSSKSSKLASRTKPEIHVAKDTSMNGISVLTQNNDENVALESYTADSQSQSQPGSILGDLGRQPDMTYDVQLLATFSVDSQGHNDKCEMTSGPCGKDTDSEVEVELWPDSEGHNTGGKPPDQNCSVDSEMEFEVAAEWCVNPEHDQPRMTEESSTHQPMVKTEADVDMLKMSQESQGLGEPVAKVERQPTRLAPFISSLIQSVQDSHSEKFEGLGNWGDQNSEKKRGDILGKRRRASCPIPTQDKSKRIRMVKSPAQEGTDCEDEETGAVSGNSNTVQVFEKEFTKFRTKNISRKTGDNFDEEGQGYSTKFVGGITEDETSSSDNSNLVIDIESTAPSGGDSNHSNSNHGNDTAQGISDNLFLLAAVSTEYCRTQKQPIDRNEQNEQEKNAFSQDKQLSQIKVKQEFPNNVRLVEFDQERGLYSCRRREDTAPEYKYKHVYGGHQDKQDRLKSKRYRAVSAGGGRQLLPEWIEQQVDRGDIPGLQWVDRKQRIVRIPWRHSRSTSWKHDDCMLFERWAIHTCKHVPGEAPNPKRWKTNFRCALNLYAVRMDHGKDYCCYKLFETAIMGNNNNHRKEKKLHEKSSFSGTRPKYRSGLDEVLNQVSPQIPTVIFDLEEKEQVKYDTEDDSSHGNGNNDNGWGEQKNAERNFEESEQNYTNMKYKRAVESTLVKMEVDSSSHGNGEVQSRQPIVGIAVPKVSLVSRKQDADSSHGSQLVPPVAKDAHRTTVLFPRNTNSSPGWDESTDVDVESCDDSNLAPLNLSLKK